MNMKKTAIFVDIIAAGLISLVACIEIKFEGDLDRSHIVSPLPYTCSMSR